MKRKINKFDCIFILLTLFYSGLMFFLFYEQCTHIEAQGYFSDMKAYILEITGQDSGYSYPYPVFFLLSGLLAKILPVPFAVATVLSILNLFGMVVTYQFLRTQYDINVFSSICIILATFSIFLVSMLFNPFSSPALEGWGHRYLGVFSPNPYHNATYLATRPFAIMLFLQFGKMMKEYEKIKLKDCIFLCAFLILSTMTKPSFIFVFAPIMFFSVLIQWIKKKFKLQKTDYAIIICAVITILLLLYQYFSVFNSSSSESSLKFGIGTAWHLWTNKIKESILLANFFPFVFLIFHIKDLKNDIYYLYSWISYIIGTATFLFLYEDGFRIWDANFAWGYMHGLFFVFFTSVCLLCKDFQLKSMRKKWYLYMETVALLLHIACGIIFMLYMICGGSASLF